MDNITLSNYTFKRVEELVKGDKYILNDKVYTIIDIKCVICKANVHHRLRKKIFKLECDEDKSLASKSFRVGYNDKTLFLYE